MKKYLFLFASLFIAGLIVISSCKKDDDIDETNQDTTIKEVYNKTSTEDAVAALSTYGTIMGEITSGADANSKGSKCAIITFEPSGFAYPKTLTIDYGTEGCDIHGHTLKGVITASFGGALQSSGSSISVSFTDFSVDTVQVNGSMTLAVTGSSITAKTIDFDVDVTNGQLTVPSGTISFACDFSCTWEMNTLLDYTDDEFKFNGTASGTNRDGKTFSIDVLEELLFKVSCAEYVSGKMEVETSDVPFPATIDFGNGTCDGTATVSTTILIEVAGQTFEQDYSYEITLP